jgi:hypothetical protein
MKSSILRILFGITILLFALSTVAIAQEGQQYANVPKMTAVGAAYKAKILCSAVFVANRDPADVQKQELVTVPFPAQIDYKNKRVTVNPGLGMPAQIAVFRDGLGCTLCTPYTLDHVLAQETGDPTPFPPSLSQQKLLWPKGDLVDTGNLPPEVDRGKLTAAVAETFTEPLADQKKIRGTRAVVVVYKGRIIAEQYAPGFSKDTPLIGWSMTKSITNALIGILVNQGKLDIMKPT